MSGSGARPPAAGSVTAVTVHGPRGVLDLTVPTGATLADVARTYAVEAGLPAPLPFVTRTGAPLRILGGGAVLWLLIAAIAARLQDFGLTHADELLLLSLRPGH